MKEGKNNNNYYISNNNIKRFIDILRILELIYPVLQTCVSTRNCKDYVLTEHTMTLDQNRTNLLIYL